MNHRYARSLALAILPVLLQFLPVRAVDAARGDTRNVRVDCARGESVDRAIRSSDDRRPLVVTVRGTCTENIVIERDDVTLQGEPGAALVAADPAQSVVSLLGARRNRIANLAVSGGRTGIGGGRGATFDVSDCTIQNNTRFGIAVSYGGTAIVDNCLIQNNGSPSERGGGVLAANGAQLVITQSTVQNNTGFGLFAGRNAHLRVGQDFDGGQTPRPVAVRGNTSNGLQIQEAAAAFVVASTVENNGGNGILASGSSSVAIGAGSAGLVAPVAIRGNGSNGVYIRQGSRGLVQGSVVENSGSIGIIIEGAAATVIGSEVRNNGRYGISAVNGASARIGLDDNGAPGGNVIENNVLEGVHVVGSSSVWMFGNLIRGNSTTNGRFGMLATDNSSIRLIGLNQIVQNGSIVGGAIGGGVLLRASGLFVLRGDFNITPNTNDISANVGDGIVAVENSTLDLRDGITILNNSNFGVNMLNQTALRGQTLTITGNAVADVRLAQGSSARFGPAGPSIVGTFVCGDAESSIAGIPLPPGCTAF